MCLFSILSLTHRKKGTFCLKNVSFFNQFYKTYIYFLAGSIGLRAMGSQTAIKAKFKKKTAKGIANVSRDWHFKLVEIRDCLRSMGCQTSLNCFGTYKIAFTQLAFFQLHELYTGWSAVNKLAFFFSFFFLNVILKWTDLMCFNLFWCKGLFSLFFGLPYSPLIQH